MMNSKHLSQCCVQLPFEKQFWLGILHLGIASSLQQSVCEHVLPNEPTGVCRARVMALQLLVGYVSSLAVGWWWERSRRSSFLKNVRAERTEPAPVAKKSSRSGSRRSLREDAASSLVVSH